MSDNSFNAAAEAVPDQGNATAPETVDQASQGDDSQEHQEPRTFTQEELDRIVAKEKAKLERKLQREQAQAQPQRVEVGEPPDPKDFNDALSYADALAEFKAEQKLAEREAAKHRETLDTTYAEREDAAREKYDDFHEVVYSPNLPISEYMAEVIKASDLGPDIAYHLGKNPGEARRIAGLPPLKQAAEIGKIEVSLTANPPVKKVSSAPDPISPVRRSSGTPTYDPTDPRSAKMDVKDWMRARNEQVAKRSQ